MLTLVLLLSSIQKNVYAKSEEVVAKVNGKEIYLEESDYEYLEMRKKDLESYGKYHHMEYTKSELKIKLQEELDEEIRRQVEYLVERELLEQILGDKDFQGNEYEFFEERFKVTEKSVKDYIEENKEKLKEWTYKGWNSVSKEDMENIKTKLEDKELLEKIVKLEKEERRERRPTLLEEYKRNQIEYELNKDYERVGMSGGSSSGNISPLYSDLMEDDDTIVELSKLKIGETSDIIQIGKDYHIYLLIDEKKLDHERVEMNLRYEEYRKFIKSLREEADIEYMYPEIKIQLDTEETEKFKFANVNGEDLYLEAYELNTMGILGEEDIEKYLEEVKENAIRRELMYKAALDEGFKADGDEKGEKWRAISRYTEKLLDEMEIIEEEIDEYIKEKGGEVFKISLTTIEYAEPNRYIFESDEDIQLTEEELNKKSKENANKLYEELKKDEKAYRIARIMANSFEEEYDLSEEEIELLSKYNSFEDFYISGEWSLLSTEMDNEDQYLYDQWEEIKDLEAKSITKPIEKRDKLNDINNYLSVVILDRIGNREKLKEDIINQIKFKKLDGLTQDMIDSAEIKYY